MTSRRDILVLRLLVFAGLAGLTGCTEPAVEQPPLERAKSELAAGHVGDAQIILDRLLAEGTAVPALAAYLGEAALARGDLEGAAKWLDTGDFAEDTRAHGFRMQGQLAMARGNLPAAGRAYDRSLAIDAKNAGLWVDIGRLRYRGGEQMQALEAAEQAVTISPDDAAALQFRGQLARDSQGLLPSVHWFERALAQQPDNLDIRIDLAATLGDAGRAMEALEVLREDDRATVHPRGQFVQAVIAARGHNLPLARDFLDRTGLGREGVPSALLLSAIIDIRQKNFDSAAQTLDRLYQRQPDNGRVVDLLALALSRSGSEAELVHRFASRASTPGGSNYLRILVGRAYESLGDRNAAAKFIDLASRGNRGLSALPLTGEADEAQDRVRIAVSHRQHGEAIAQARSLVRRFPGSGDALALLGDAELARDNRQAADAAYRTSARVRRPWPLIPRLVSSMDDKAQAKRLLEDYVAANPSNGEAAAMLADAYALEGKWAKSVVLLDHAIVLGHDRVPWVLSARSIAAAHLGDKDDALQFAIAANALQPMNPSTVRALLDALPKDQGEARTELTAKLRSLSRW